MNEKKAEENQAYVRTLMWKRYNRLATEWERAIAEMAEPEMKPCEINCEEESTQVVQCMNVCDIHANQLRLES